MALQKNYRSSVKLKIVKTNKWIEYAKRNMYKWYDLFYHTSKALRIAKKNGTDATGIVLTCSLDMESYQKYCTLMMKKRHCEVEQLEVDFESNIVKKIRVIPMIYKLDYENYDLVRSVSERKALAAKLAKQYAGKTGRELHPVTANGRSIAKSFWGKAWCRNIESYQDYESRLPRGRSYLKNGAVIDLNIEPGLVTAMVAGSELYQVKIAIDPLDEERWNAIKRACAGKIGSLIDLVQGKLSDEIIGILCAPDTGLFPLPDEIRLDCDCPDWADLCKHLAAVLYGIGAKLDEDPGLFFVLRGVDRNELFEGDLAAALPPEAADLDAAALGDAFGIDLDTL